MKLTERRINDIPLWIHRENFKYYLFQYWVDKYNDYKLIVRDKKNLGYGFDAEPCGKKYYSHCGGTVWREKNKHLYK